MHKYGFIKVAAITPVLKVANPDYNVGEIAKLIKEASNQRAIIAVFPELSITGYTCGDLFGQTLLEQKSYTALATLLNNTKDTDILGIVGMPLAVLDGLYNCAVAFRKGNILGVVPKMFIPNYKEFYEKRWFRSGREIVKSLTEITLLGQTVPFGNLIFQSDCPKFGLGIEICEDIWSVVPPSSYLALKGAHIICNLSASNDLVNKAEYRRNLIVQQSARTLTGYIYASTGVHESTTDIVFGGERIIAENGSLLSVSDRFGRGSEIIYSDIDVERLTTERLVNQTFADSQQTVAAFTDYQIVPLRFESLGEAQTLDREIAPLPFVPGNPLVRDERCAEIFNIQVAGLCKRLEHTGITKAVIGVSGGLDSTLALLVVVQAFKTLKLPLAGIMAVTMPGFGTTDTTYYNAIGLMQELGVTIKEIDIRPACFQHFNDIGHDPDNHNVVYENTQARERTQVLMDIANQINGLVVGTGDLSELALGWCTFSGDHISMYGVNASIPKTLIRYLVNWVADLAEDQRIGEILRAITETPISPELLPPDKQGNIQQKTESTIGPYELHDFFLFYMLRYGMSPHKIIFLATNAFKNQYSLEEIKKWLQVFYQRFFRQQFKRSCLPDGPKVGSVSLSPRGDWRMPSDASAELWLKELE